MKETKTHVANIRVDIRTFATCYMYFKEKGFNEIKGSKGRAISLAFKFFTRMVIEKHPEYEFTLHGDAVTFLESEGVINLDDKFTNKYNLVKELQFEDSSSPNSHHFIKQKIKSQKKSLPDGIESHQQMEDAQKNLEKDLFEEPEIVVNEETLEQAEERRKKSDNEMDKALKNLTRGE